MEIDSDFHHLSKKIPVFIQLVFTNRFTNRFTGVY